MVRDLAPILGGGLILVVAAGQGLFGGQTGAPWLLALLAAGAAWTLASLLGSGRRAPVPPSAWSWLTTLGFGGLLWWSLVHRHWWAAAAVPVVVGLSVLARRRLWRRRIPKLLRAPEPEPLVTHLRQRLQGEFHPVRVGASFFDQALVYALYGAFDQAERCIQSVSWAEQDPFLRPLHALARAAILYLQEEWREGLRWARIARAYQTEIDDEELPDERALDQINRIIELGALHNLTAIDPERLAALEATTEDDPILLKALLVWGVERAYERLNDRAALAAVRSVREELVPHLLRRAPSP